MAAENCPFQIEPKPESYSDTHQKDHFVSIDIAFDPMARNTSKATPEFCQLDSTEPEEVLTFIKTVAQAVVTLAVAAGEPRFWLVQSLLAGDPEKQRIIITTAEAS
jgi:hypothetical protein